MDLTFGYKNQQGTGLSDEMLASDQYQMISITVDTAARDAGNSPTTDLRKGLVLRYDGTSKTYKEVSNANQSPTAVVLAENIPSIDVGNVVVKAYYHATFKTGKLLDPGALFDITLCKRIYVRDNV